MYKGEDATITVQDRDGEQADVDDAQTSGVEEGNKVGEAIDADGVEIVEQEVLDQFSQDPIEGLNGSSAPQNDAYSMYVVETAVEQRDVPDIEMI